MQPHFIKVLRIQSLAHTWWESFNLGEALVSPVAPIARRSAWGSDMFFLCMGSEAVPCWKRRRCWQGRALQELCCGRSSHGGSWANHLCCIIWTQPAEMVSSACFCMGSCIVSIKWDCGCKKKMLLLLVSTNPHKALCQATYRAKKKVKKLHITATYRAKKVSEFHPLAMEQWKHGCILQKTCFLVRDGEGYTCFCLSH